MQPRALPLPLADRRPDAGVTLVEILVVLAILGVMTGLTALSLPAANRARTLAQEADLLVSRLHIAAEYSVVSGRPVQMGWTEQGYSFREWDGQEWITHRAPALAPLRDLDGIALGTEGTSTGEITLRPDLSPPGRGPVIIAMVTGDRSARVVFDGASAWVETP